MRVPPHNLEAEESVLGAMMLSADAIGVAAEHCTVTDFYRPSHALIFEAILELNAAGHPVDVVTLAEQLRHKGCLDDVGGTPTLISLQSNTPAIASAGRYATIVAEHKLLRRLISAGTEIQELGYRFDAEPRELLDKAESLVYDSSLVRSATESAELPAVLSETLAWLEERYNAGDEITGTPTGFLDIDYRLGGLQDGSLITIGARPSMGKTAFALGIAAGAARAGKRPLFFSLEMSQREIGQRLLSMVGRVDSQRMQTGRLVDDDWRKLSSALSELAALPMTIHDDPNVTISDIRSRARHAKARGGLGIILVDYIQLMTGRSNAENRQVEIAEISRGLKVLARELAVPVVALSQLSRNLESRSDKRPMMSDLRESGAIEQDSDIVMFLYRDEVYFPDSDDAGSAEVIVAKHRNGPTGVEHLAWMKTYTAFGNMAREDQGFRPALASAAGSRSSTSSRGGLPTR